MPQIIEVKFKGNRKDYFTWDHGSDLEVGSAVVVEVERGRDLGEVTAVGELAEKKCSLGCNGCSRGRKEATGKVLRTASSNDTHLIDELRKAEEDVRRKVMERVAAHGLNMKVSDAEWQWDRKKLTIYFTAEKRVDFRALVRDLAALFRTRIELRQIGARDEAKRLDGVGRCGRQYCCSSWLPELKPVSLSLAKEQSLSLNPSQISGGCGRLLCCLRYEHDFYVKSRKRFPKVGRNLHTDLGRERVEAIDIFRERVLLRGPQGATRSLPLVELRRVVQEPDSAREEPAEQTDGGTTAPQPSSGNDSDAVSPTARKRPRRRGRRPGPPRDLRSDPPGETPPEDGDTDSGE